MRCRCIVRILVCFALIAGWTAIAAAAVKLPAIFGDDMVLQRGRPVPVWGWADKGEKVTGSIAGQTLATKADQQGRWKVTLDALDSELMEVAVKNQSGDIDFIWMPAQLTMTVEDSSGSTLVFKNILVGEVWLCSGQSNMVWGLGASNNGRQEIAKADYPSIRLFFVPKVKAAEPAEDVAGRWAPCTPENVVKVGRGSFSAVAYYFGRQLHEELGVPVGLIQSSWGGTPAEFWTSRKTLKADPVLKPLIGNSDSSALYNGMIAPLVPYAIRGAIWYQGESNVGRTHQYRTLFPAMIANWRSDWGQGDFPFGFVQLAPYRYDGQNPANCAELREAQLMTLKSVPNTGMAVTMDIGNVKNIHPGNKLDVGKRLALWALAKVYGRDVVYSGPIYKSMAVEGDKIRLGFDHVDGGLIASDGKPLADFTIAGVDEKFVPAEAKIDGDSIVVNADGVARPVAVRYAWRDDATPNLASKAGLPASPFRTDQWKGVTERK